MSTIYVISDGTGRTAQQAVKAALTQFKGSNPEIKRYGDILNIQQVMEVVSFAKAEKAIIIHTLVTDKLREELVKLTRIHHVESIDLMGPLLHRLSDHLSANPSEEPGLYRVLSDSYFRKIETMQFAIKHDDGKRIYNIDKAEIIILGVSRTFKTPLSIYLAFRGWYVANVPIILDFPVPDEVLQIPSEKIYCLTTYPSRLTQLRRAREDRLKVSTGNYADPVYVRKEINYANRIFNSHPDWQKINVTSKSIEEIAAEIITLLPKKMIFNEDPND
ncbi:MAG: kinase/pyrophosphorylase, partial [Bacteroidales bacterium]|nr:kinase/pyrophosphorylase [Bacteroidales bacterium]